MVSSGDGAVELGAAGALGLGLWGRQGWGKEAAIDPPAGTSTVESEIESRWGWWHGARRSGSKTVAALGGDRAA